MKIDKNVLDQAFTEAHELWRLPAGLYIQLLEITIRLSTPDKTYRKELDYDDFMVAFLGLDFRPIDLIRLWKTLGKALSEAISMSKN